ncbi:methionyl-tRNA formyltransferase [Desulfofundulus thermosubterraneus]|uniref:Methionyl-tRNA formyltransferase n=1 Tax=Desulfofundulus thermosubterraneus DSM 16057 TaxID=1121432 RepID=A0A1M6BPJ3_9FIRM|nr:methionyl-tRNA formyltransferase [Desulfofundulus thermosubterraneus]SHI50675.1 methionyl-tRNA formyltransferase [Desulfofundulus thermosubterraneus DSM 16057]
MRVVFMGTPDFAVPALKALVGAGYPVVGVVTQPDRPKGRGKKIQPSPVKQAALHMGLPVLQPVRVRDAAFVEQLKQLEPEVIVVAAFGQILPPSILHLPPRRCINIHASLLPRYRGAAPIHRAIMNGERETGVTIMLMDEGLDTGDILLQQAVAIGEADNAGALHDRLALLGAELLLQTLNLLKRGCLHARPQEDSFATYAPPLTREDEIIDWERPARDLYNQIRGLDPWPGARTWWGEQVLKVWRAGVKEEAAPKGALPGQVIAGGEEVVVATGRGCLSLQEVQLQGGRRLPVAEFLRGHPLAPGTVLGRSKGGCHS